MENYSEYDYFKLRKLDKIYVSKVFPHKTFQGKELKEERFVRKVFEKSEENEFVKVNGEIVLRSSATGRDQVTATVITDEESMAMSFVLQKFRNNAKTGLKPIESTNFTFNKVEFVALLKFLSDLKFLDFNNKSRFTVQSDKDFDKIISLWLQSPTDPFNLNNRDSRLLSGLSKLSGEERELLLKTLRSKVLTHEDLNILSGRKEGLDLFKNELFKEKHDWNEKHWQEFFEKNKWIFGYGLDYKFLNIVQREASISNIDLDGKQTVNTDFLMSDNRFTVLVELKRPDTPLFMKDQNRSKSWQLSKSLTDSVSQILTQKAEWELKSQHDNFDSEGKLITEKTIDPKTILIIGNTSQFDGNDRESQIKAKTFELYRRNSRNIEILTYDELFDRAAFIVDSKAGINETKNSNETDDLPF